MGTSDNMISLVRILQRGRCVVLWDGDNCRGDHVMLAPLSTQCDDRDSNLRCRHMIDKTSSISGCFNLKAQYSLKSSIQIYSNNMSTYDAFNDGLQSVSNDHFFFLWFRTQLANLVKMMQSGLIEESTVLCYQL